MQSLQGNILFVLCYLCCISGSDTLSDRQHLKFIALMFYSKLWGGNVVHFKANSKIFWQYLSV